MSKDHIATELVPTLERLHDKLKASMDFDKPGDAADYASALKDAAIPHRELEED